MAVAAAKSRGGRYKSELMDCPGGSTVFAKKPTFFLVVPPALAVFNVPGFPGMRFGT